MDDSRIIELFFCRDESAIDETRKKYGNYCYKIAYNILSSPEDSEECVSDTYLRAWNSIPPTRPERLQSFLGTITRNLALDRYDRIKAQKRTGAALIFEELSECLPDRESDETGDLKDAINSFLASLPKHTRIIFMRRYWYLSPISEIARDMGMTEGSIKVLLHRTRKKFKAHLEKEGICL